MHFLQSLPAQKAWLQRFLNGINHRMSALSALDLIWRKQTFTDVMLLRTTSLPRDCHLTAIPRMPLISFCMCPVILCLLHFCYIAFWLNNYFDILFEWIWITLNARLKMAKILVQNLCAFIAQPCWILDSDWSSYSNTFLFL